MAEPIILRAILDLKDALPRECPSIQGASYDKPFDYESPKLPWAWVFDFEGEIEPGGTDHHFTTVSVWVEAAYRFSNDRDNQGCRYRGNILLAEIIRGLLKDAKRGWNTESNNPLAANTRLVKWGINPVASAADIAAVTMVWEVDLLFQRLDPWKQ